MTTVFSVILLFLAAIVAAINAQSAPIDLQNWMKNLPSSAKSLPITRLTIPGSHNSFTNNLDVKSEMADSQTYSWIDITSALTGPVNRLLSIFGIRQSSGSAKSPKDIAFAWSRNQDINTTQQLNIGIRYFDARLAYHSAAGQIKIVHGLYGQNILTEFTPLAQFARSRPQELIILYLRDFVNFNSEIHSTLALRLKQIFNGTLLAYQTEQTTRNLASITLNSIASQRMGNVLIVYDEQTTSSKVKTFWPSGSIVTLWANSGNPDNIISHIDYSVQNYLEPEDDRYSFFLEAQGVATPGQQEITNALLRNAGSTLGHTMAFSTTAKFVDWLNQQKGVLPKGAVNLCLADFVNTRYTNAAIGLNY